MQTKTTTSTLSLELLLAIGNSRKFVWADKEFSHATQCPPCQPTPGPTCGHLAIHSDGGVGGGARRDGTAGDDLCGQLRHAPALPLLRLCLLARRWGNFLCEV